MLYSSAGLLVAASLAYTIYLTNQSIRAALFQAFRRRSRNDCGTLKKKKLPYQLSGSGTLAYPAISFMRFG